MMIKLKRQINIIKTKVYDLNIDVIKEKCIDATIEATNHFLYRCQQRNILFGEVKEAILHGEIIEEYPDDYPYPSCLILGRKERGRNLHVVVGLGDSKLWFITAYEPSDEQWQEGFKFRKE